jgi:hypothetical protein
MRRLVVVLGVVLMALAACSSSKKSTSVSLAPASAGNSGSQSTAETLSTAATSSGASSSGGSTKFCGDAATNNLATQLGKVATGGNTAAELQAELNALHQYEHDAPSAIKADVTTVVNFYAKYVQIFENDQGNPTKLGADLQAVQPEEPNIQPAIQRITAYYAANCHA